ncbi:MAG TPA: hypothetical protein VJ600_01605 [Holophagaceae bacterium]|nr:hypothetical protein [Holophagaceae bacterium]
MQQLRSSRSLRPAAGLAGLSLALALVGCGGGASQGASTSNASPAPTPAPKAAALPEPFWASDAPIRPSVAPLFAAKTATAPAIALTAAEQAALATPSPAAARIAPAVQPLAPQLRIVTGLRSFSYHQDTTTTLQAFDLSAATIQAMVPNTAGGFDTLTGVGHNDGTFSIQNVPEGYYWLRFGSTYVWTNTNFIDWSNDVFGRADANYPSIDPTSLNLALTNLNAWQPSDELTWVVPNQGEALSLPLTSTGISNAPAPGDTTLPAFGMNFTNGDLFFPLLDATRGDQAYLNQLTTRPAGSDSYRALAKSYLAPATTMTDGVATSLSGGFLDVPQTSTLRLNWKRSAFAAFAPAVNPSATPSGSYFFSYAYPLPSTYGLPYNAFQLLDYSGSGTADLDLGDLPYGNPFPAAWTVAAEAYQAFSVSYLAPGAANPLTLTRYAYQATTTLPTATAPMAPLLGPVQNFKINGKDLFSNQLSVGTSPTLTWSAPAVGAASGYVVTCFRIFASGGNTAIQTVGRFRTKATSMTLPGVLAPGNTYIFTISAIRANGVDMGQTPFRATLPYAFTTAMSAIVAP